MDFNKASIGDIVLYQGNTCAYPVERGNTYEVVGVVAGKPRAFKFVDDEGIKRLAMLSYSWVKVKQGG